MWPSRSLTQPGEPPLSVNRVLAASRNAHAESDRFSPPPDPHVFRRQMAEALKKLNVPVTVVLDAAVGYARFVKRI